MEFLILRHGQTQVLAELIQMVLKVLVRLVMGVTNFQKHKRENQVPVHIVILVMIYRSLHPMEELIMYLEYFCC